MTFVKKHLRKSKNKVSVVRKHSRISVTRKNYYHEYDEENGDMIAKFPGGATYRYHGVTPKEYAKVQKDKFKALAEFKVSKTYSPDNAIAKKSFSSAKAKQKSRELAKKIQAIKKGGAKTPATIAKRIKK